MDQIAKNQERISKLREEGIGESDYRALNVHFITNTEKKAEALVSELDAVGYKCDWTPPEERNYDYLILGRTNEIEMSDDSIGEWTNLMCDLAAAQDCEFCTWEL